MDIQGEGLQNNSFSVFLLDAQRVATIKIPAMYPFVPFGGIPATVVLLPPADPPIIHLVLKEGLKKSTSKLILRRTPLPYHM